MSRTIIDIRVAIINLVTSDPHGQENALQTVHLDPSRWLEGFPLSTSQRKANVHEIETFLYACLRSDGTSNDSVSVPKFRLPKYGTTGRQHFFLYLEQLRIKCPRSLYHSESFWCGVQNSAPLLKKPLESIFSTVSITIREIALILSARFVSSSELQDICAHGLPELQLGQAFALKGSPDCHPYELLDAILWTTSKGSPPPILENIDLPRLYYSVYEIHGLRPRTIRHMSHSTSDAILLISRFVGLSQGLDSYSTFGIFDILDNFKFYPILAPLPSQPVDSNDSSHHEAAREYTLAPISKSFASPQDHGQRLERLHT